MRIASRSRSEARPCASTVSTYSSKRMTEEASLTYVGVGVLAASRPHWGICCLSLPNQLARAGLQLHRRRAAARTRGVRRVFGVEKRMISFLLPELRG